MLKAMFDNLAVLSFEKTDNAKMHVFNGFGKKIGYIKSLSYDTNDTNDTNDDFEFCTRDVKLTKAGIESTWVGTTVHPASQRVPLDIVIEEGGRATGMLKNCWLERGDLKKGQWLCEEFESMITFVDA